MNWQEIWQNIVNWFQSNTWNILAFLVVLVGGIAAITIINIVIRSVMRKRDVDPIAIRFVIAIVRFTLYLFLVLVLLTIVNVPITGITTTVSAAVLAVGMALKEFLSNLASGIILVGSKKYKTGDYIKVSTVEGNIVDINFLFTTLKTPDSTQVTLPNSTMVNSPVTNLGAYEARRVAITFSVAYESDTDLVIKTMLEVMDRCPLVLENPAPACRLKTLSASSIDFFVTCFCDQSKYWDTYFYVMEYGFNELKRAGIAFPFTQIELANKEPTPMIVAEKPLPERIDKSRPEEEKKFTLTDLDEMTFDEISERLKKASGKSKKQSKTTKKDAKSKGKEKTEPADPDKK